MPNTLLQPPARQRAGRWPSLVAALCIAAGTILLLYPFIPALRFAVARPVPTIPYATQLDPMSEPVRRLAQLPIVEQKPVPSDNRLVIPSIKVDMPILEGPDERVLNRGGIWRIPHTSTPDQGSNTVVSGHRWQYLPPSSMTLYLLDKVRDGEPVIIYWQGKEYDYVVRSRAIVNPSQTEILGPTEQPTLTIFTCTPIFSTKQRLVLYAELIS